MIKKLFFGVALAGALIATPFAFAAYNATPESASPALCACCGDACQCDVCICDEKGCACDTGGACFCTPACCETCCDQ